MSKILNALIIIAFVTLWSFAQDANISEKRKNLSENLVANLQAGRLDNAIDAGEKLVALEKSVQSKDTVSLTNATLNLARMKRDVFLILKDRINNRQIEPSQTNAAGKKLRENAKQADELYRQALQLNEQAGRGETAQTADIKGELGWLLYNYKGSKQSVDDSEKFFLESIALNEKIRGAEAEQTLFVVLKTGDFYNEMDNYEKSLPYYERYIQSYEKNQKKDSPNLVNALRPLAKILYTTFQENEAREITNRIEKLTAQTESPFVADLDLHLRSKDSIATTMKLIPEYQEELKYFRARLIAEGRTLNRNSISQISSLKVVPVNVTVDENGKVLQAIVSDNIKSKDKKLASRAEETVSKWFVRPFSYKGEKRKIRGILRYIELN